MDDAKIAILRVEHNELAIKAHEADMEAVVAESDTLVGLRELPSLDQIRRFNAAKDRMDRALSRRSQ